MSQTEENIEESVAIIWDGDRGKRLALWRMTQNLTQVQFGDLLGIKQQVVHALEAGRMTVCERFTLAEFRAVAGEALGYILFGQNDPGTREADIRMGFWNHQHSKMRHKKNVRKKTNADLIAAGAREKTPSPQKPENRASRVPTRRGNRTPGPRPKNKHALSDTNK